MFGDDLAATALAAMRLAGGGHGPARSNLWATEARPADALPAEACRSEAGWLGGSRWRGGDDRAGQSSADPAAEVHRHRRVRPGQRGRARGGGRARPSQAEFLGPTAENSVAGQIEFVTNAADAGRDAMMISNNAGDQIVPAVQRPSTAGIGRGLGLADPVRRGREPVRRPGRLRRDRRRDGRHGARVLGDDGGQIAILSASPDAANQNAWIAALNDRPGSDEYANLELVDTVYGNDESEESYNQALALVDQYPDLKLIMAPTTVGIAAAAKAMQDEGLCDTVKVSGLGLPDEMREYTVNGCAPEFALWSFVDLGYLTYYAAYGIATGQIEAAEGATFRRPDGQVHDREGPDPRQRAAVVMGPFTVYDETNVGS